MRRLRLTTLLLSMTATGGFVACQSGNNVEDPISDWPHGSAGQGPISDWPDRPSAGEGDVRPSDEDPSEERADDSPVPSVPSATEPESGAKMDAGAPPSGFVDGMSQVDASSPDAGAAEDTDAAPDAGISTSP